MSLRSVSHCGKDIQSHRDRTIRATPEEERRGVKEVNSREYWCQDARCRKRLIYKQEIFETGLSEWARVRTHQMAAFIKRLQLAKESDWVWGYHKDLYTKIKVTVR